MLEVEFEKLLVRPKANSGESLRGYVDRVLAANGYDVRVERANRAWLLPWHQVRGRSGYQRESNFASDEGGVSLPTYEALCGYHVKYCQSCASEFGYQLWTTEYAASAVCPVHLEWLATKCNACHRKISHKDLRLQQCQCGQGIDCGGQQQRLSPPMAAWELSLYQGVEGLIRRAIDAHRATLPLWLQELTSKETAILLQSLLTISRAAGEKMPTTASRHALVQWPTYFQALIRRLISRATEKANCQILEISHVLRSVPCLDALFKTFRDAEIGRQVEVSLDVFRVSSSRKTPFRQRFIANPVAQSFQHISCSLVSADDVALDIGWRSDEIRDAMRRLELPRFELPSGRIAIDVTLASEFKGYVRGYRSCTAIASDWGLRASEFLRLLEKTNIYQAAIELSSSFAVVEGCSLCLIPESAIERFLALVRAGCSELQPGEARWGYSARLHAGISSRRWQRTTRRRRPIAARRTSKAVALLESILLGNPDVFFYGSINSLGDLFMESRKYGTLIQRPEGWSASE